jgi:hypothetical protein
LPLKSSKVVFVIETNTWITWSRVTPVRWVRLSAPSHASVPALAHKTLRYERVYTQHGATVFAEGGLTLAHGESIVCKAGVVNSVVHQSHVCTRALMTRPLIVKCELSWLCALLIHALNAVRHRDTLALWWSRPKRTVTGIAHFGLARGFVSPRVHGETDPRV